MVLFGRIEPARTAWRFLRIQVFNLLPGPLFGAGGVLDDDITIALTMTYVNLKAGKAKENMPNLSVIKCYVYGSCVHAHERFIVCIEAYMMAVTALMDIWRNVYMLRLIYVAERISFARSAT